MVWDTTVVNKVFCWTTDGRIIRDKEGRSISRICVYYVSITVIRNYGFSVNQSTWLNGLLSFPEVVVYQGFITGLRC